MTVAELKKELENVPDETQIVFQGNVKGEEDLEDGNEMTHTTCTGDLFSAWRRERDNEFVLDCAITDSEL